VVHRSLILPQFGQPERRGIYCSSNLLRECRRVSTVCRTSGTDRLSSSWSRQPGTSEIQVRYVFLDTWPLFVPWLRVSSPSLFFFCWESGTFSSPCSVQESSIVLPQQQLFPSKALARVWRAKINESTLQNPRSFRALNPHTLERVEQTTLSVTSHNSRWPQGYGLESQRWMTTFYSQRKTRGNRERTPRFTRRTTLDVV